MLAAMIASVHLLAVLAVIIGLIIVLLASAPAVSEQDLKAINRVYQITGFALLLAAVAGCALWLAGGKPAEFYSNNPVFHAKLGLFALLLAVIGYTGFRFQQLQRKHVSLLLTDPQTTSATPGESSIVVGDSLRRVQKIFIPLMIVIPALAWMMARGIGY